jgi:hypothetical protein
MMDNVNYFFMINNVSFENVGYEPLIYSSTTHTKKKVKVKLSTWMKIACKGY